MGPEFNLSIADRPQRGEAEALVEEVPAPPVAEPESLRPSLTSAGALRVAYLAVEGILWNAESEGYGRHEVRKDLRPLSQMLLDAAWVHGADE